ncbi:uncharacterized protein [Diabrotica undecimpunctata]|uniref:uncharacterized protein isoform X2 n=1 Tax=Diabrotica undecimpunctata TaxID=50387 RepID=UPI003B63A0CE
MPQSKSKPPKKKSKSIRKREYYTLPAKAHTSNKVPASVDKDEKRSGVFSQMAATAGGVAVGTTVGHFVGNILTSIIGLVHAARNGVWLVIKQLILTRIFNVMKNREGLVRKKFNNS